MKKLFFVIACLYCAVAVGIAQPVGAVSGEFSVSATTKVYFANGNLQYHCANKQWRFASHQYDTIGGANINLSETYDGWIDLYGWSTESTYFGVSTATEESDYSGDFVDWGTAVGAGWRTLTIDEIKYLIGYRGTGRTDAAAKYGVACVAGIDGVILLPDEWELPDDVALFFTFNSGVSTTSSCADHNNYSAEQWQKLEEAGAVFLPVTGMRHGSEMQNESNEPNTGFYWTGSVSGDDVANLTISAQSVRPNPDYRAYAEAVRLVYNVPSTPTAVEQVPMPLVYIESGRVVCAEPIRIFDLLGRDVTGSNGSLKGIYVVKTSSAMQKVFVN
ncbi:MAG: hypothetical protein ACI392_07535 [Paludibacteraceae bacterium]